MRVLAIDPGERVGYATGEIVDDPVKPGAKTLRVTGHGISFLKDFALKLHEVAGGYDVIVYETWRLRAALANRFAGSDFPAVQLVGMIRLCAWVNPNVKLVGQGPAIKSTALKTVGPDIKRILDGLPKAHDDAHDGDALMHLHYYFWSKHL